MDQQDFYQKLELLLTRLKSTKRKKYELNEDTKQSIGNFMSEQFDLYLTLRRNPQLLQDQKYLDYINETSPLLTGLIDDIYFFKMGIQDIVQSTFYNDEWLGVCRQRSALESLKEMYAGTLFGEHCPEFEDEDLDDIIQATGRIEGHLSQEEIPDGIPHSHWWWWSPQKPGFSGDK